MAAPIPTDGTGILSALQKLNRVNVNRGTGTTGDFCELIGEKPDAAIMRLGTSVAGVLGSH